MKKLELGSFIEIIQKIKYEGKEAKLQYMEAVERYNKQENS